MERLAERRTASIPGACTGWAETQAAYWRVGENRPSTCYAQVCWPERDGITDPAWVTPATPAVTSFIDRAVGAADLPSALTDHPSHDPEDLQLVVA
ncbi:MAG: transposase DNA-binding-containing protein [Chromatiaceae bacterium]